MLTDSSVHNSTLENLEDYINSLNQAKIAEMQNLENLQAWYYAETVKKANLEEDIDNVLYFLSEFIAKKRGGKKRQADDKRAFSTLSQEDQNYIGEMLLDSDY